MATEPEINSVRLAPPVFALVAVVSLGGAALWLMGNGRWTYWEAVYYAVICASTVGFAELPGMDAVPGSRVVTTFVILGGLGVVAYFQSALTTFLVEDVLGHRFRYRRMQRKIAELDGHIVVAGAGSTGRHVIAELLATNSPFVVIERTQEAVDALKEDFKSPEMLFVLGDATHDAVLQAAGIAKARGIVAALTEDKDNLFVTLSARDLNANARIVSKVIAAEAEHKMIRAGANATVSPNRIGGMRMASEMLRPTAVRFLDRMLQAKGGVLRVEEVKIPSESWFVGRALKDLPIRTKTSALVVAILEGDDFHYNPEPNTVIRKDDTLVVMGDVTNIEKLRELARKTAE